MNSMERKLTKKERDRRQGMETNLYVRSFDAPFSAQDFQKLPRLPISVILDNLRSAFNVGSMIRTADCVRAEKIYFCGYTAHPPHGKLDKTSLGALPYVPWTYQSSVIEAIHEIKKKNQPLIALETTNQSHGLWEYTFPLPCTLILGNEALGVSKTALRMADDIVEIPMMGFKNSINVAVAFGIVAYEIQRQYWKIFAPQWHRHRQKLQGGNHENEIHSPRHHSH
ncbi:RNA methyltransferase [bacterium]|nr:RNA methyltransferase [bacterium]